MASIGRGRHLLIDCTEVDVDVCLDDKRFLRCLAESAEKAGANVISQVRYHLGHNSPPGFTCAILLDESHCTAHTYSDLGMIALDIFTCGSTDPDMILQFLEESLNTIRGKFNSLGKISKKTEPRFLIEVP